MNKDSHSTSNTETYRGENGFRNAVAATADGGSSRSILTLSKVEESPKDSLIEIENGAKFVHYHDESASEIQRRQRLLVAKIDKDNGLTGGENGDALDSDDDGNNDPKDNKTSFASHWLTRDLCLQVHRFRSLCGLIVNNARVQFTIVIFIAVNSIMMGIGTFDFVRNDPAVSNAFEVVDLIFLILFTVELALQFGYMGLHLFVDGWLIFDTIVIVMSWAFSEVQVIRAFRIFRALRLITRIKVLKNLIMALLGVMPRMAAIGLLLFLISYIFAVMYTQLFKDLYERGLTENDYFGRLDDTFFTLFQIMTLDAWSDVARQVMAVYGWAWIPFVVFVIVTGFVVVNLIIAVICDAISALHQDEKAKLHGNYDEDAAGMNESAHPAAQVDVREQLEQLENHVMELTRMQETTLQTLTLLTQQLQRQRLATAAAAASVEARSKKLMRRNNASVLAAAAASASRRISSRYAAGHDIDGPPPRMEEEEGSEVGELIDQVEATVTTDLGSNTDYDVSSPSPSRNKSTDD